MFFNIKQWLSFYYNQIVSPGMYHYNISIMAHKLRGPICCKKLVQITKKHMEHTTGFVRDFGMQIQGVFKDNSRTKAKIAKERYINIHSTYVSAQEAQNTQNETFLGISRAFLYGFR